MFTYECPDCGTIHSILYGSKALCPCTLSPTGRTPSDPNMQGVIQKTPEVAEIRKSLLRSSIPKGKFT